MSHPDEPPGDEAGINGAPSSPIPDAQTRPAASTKQRSTLAVRPWRRPSRIPRPTQAELEALPAKDRLELLDKRQAARHQWLNTSGILLTIVFTALGLFLTRQTLVSSQQSQITDRYTKAVEQLGSNEREVRLGAVYALERIAYDSDRDRPTIIDVLAAFVRERDPAASIEDVNLPAEPDTDIQAALTVLGRIPHLDQQIDLHSIRTPHANLEQAHLDDVDLTDADLTDARIGLADLTGAYMKDAHLELANLEGANLDDANLDGAYLRKASLDDARLERSGLRRAYLRGASLYSADLRAADLSGADLRGADLRSSDLGLADLSGADLRGATLGWTVDEIRKAARTDSSTKF